MCAAACSLWWLGWILYKTSQGEGSYQCRSTPSTGAALVSASDNGGRGENSTLWHSNENNHGVQPRWPWLFLPFSFPLSLSASAFSFFQGRPPLSELKANRAARTRAGIRVNTGLLWRVCWLSDRVWWTFLILSLWCSHFFLFCRVRCFETPHPGLTCWTVTSKQMASIAAHGDLWPPWALWEELFEKPSWFNNIFSPRAAKALSCLTPVAPSVELAHNCVYLPSILQSFVMSCPLDTWIHALKLCKNIKLNMEKTSLLYLWNSCNYESISALIMPVFVFKKINLPLNWTTLASGRNVSQMSLRGGVSGMSSWEETQGVLEVPRLQSSSGTPRCSPEERSGTSGGGQTNGRARQMQFKSRIIAGLLGQQALWCGSVKYQESSAPPAPDFTLVSITPD